VFHHNLSLDQNTALVLSSTGTQVFVRNGTAWSFQQTLNPPPLSTGVPQYVAGVAVSGDTAVLGVPDASDRATAAGAGYVFARSGTTWTMSQKLLTQSTDTDRTGYTAAISSDTILLGGPNSKAYTGSATFFGLMAPRPNGQICGSGVECTSTFCADGLCCNTACGGDNPNDCQTCRYLSGAPQDGVCGPVPAQNKIVCRPSTGSCDIAESCNGVSMSCPADTYIADGTTCSNGACRSGQCTQIADLQISTAPAVISIDSQPSVEIDYSVNNNSTNSAPSCTVVVSADAGIGLANVDQGTAGAWTCTQAAAGLSCTAPNGTCGQSSTSQLRITVTLPADLMMTSYVTATLSSALYESNPSDNIAKVTLNKVVVDPMPGSGPTPGGDPGSGGTGSGSGSMSSGCSYAPAPAAPSLLLALWASALAWLALRRRRAV
jgi:hypothetical protein